VFEPATKRATVRLGDAGWGRDYEVIEDTDRPSSTSLRWVKIPGLIVGDLEYFWLMACWNAATWYGKRAK